MNIKVAAIAILKKAKSPLHIEELTKRIISSGLWKTNGKTPARTIGAKLYADIKKNGSKSPFVKISPQIFSLSENKVIKKQLSSITKGHSFNECAQKVLEEFSNKQPMHYRKITEIALNKKWLITEGKTPEATMYTQIITAINRQQKRGEQPRFIQYGQGLIGLSTWMGRGLNFQISDHNKQIRKDLLKNLHEMKPIEFEQIVSQLLTKIGFESVEVTKYYRDGGIDVRGTLVVGEAIRIIMAIQVKRWKKNVQAPVVQQVRGSVGAHEKGLIITTSDFSAGAKVEAEQSQKEPVALMNGRQLVMLLMENGIGVQRSTPDLFEIDEGFFLKASQK